MIPTKIKYISTSNICELSVLFFISTLKTSPEVSSWGITGLQSAVCVGVDQSTRGTKTANILHACVHFREFVVSIVTVEDFRGLAEFIVPELES